MSGDMRLAVVSMVEGVRVSTLICGSFDRNGIPGGRRDLRLPAACCPAAVVDLNATAVLLR
jgi:hypothetical protein